MCTRSHTHTHPCMSEFSPVYCASGIVHNLTEAYVARSWHFKDDFRRVLCAKTAPKFTIQIGGGDIPLSPCYKSKYFSIKRRACVCLCLCKCPISVDAPVKECECITHPDTESQLSCRECSKVFVVFFFNFRRIFSIFHLICSKFNNNVISLDFLLSVCACVR